MVCSWVLFALGMLFVSFCTVLHAFSSNWCLITPLSIHFYSHAMCLFAGISAKQVQIILEDLRQEVERQSDNKNNGTIAASHTSAPCQPIHRFLNTWLCKQIFITCLVS